MTREEREEAIEYLNTLYMALEVFPNQQISLGNVDEMKESVSMAIEALEQEPCKREIEREYLFQSLCEDFKKLQAENDNLRKRLEQEPCEDCISRQAVQDYIAKYLSQYLYNDVREAVEVIDEYIGELPSVRPQEPIIDKIRAEIEQLTITEGGEDYTRKMAELYSLKIKVLQIIDKYRGESDCRECKTEHDCYECKKYEESEVEDVRHRINY